MGANLEFGSRDLTAAMDKFLLDQAGFIKTLAIESNNGDLACDSLMPLLVAISQTANGLSVLARNGLLNETFMLGRGLLERIVNACYLTVASGEELRRYELHAKQKAYRRLERRIELPMTQVSMMFTGEVNVSAVPGLQEALDLFTSKRGKEITRWSPSSLVERVQQLGERSNANVTVFLLTVISVYEDASEALHGTLYGCTFHLGVFSPGTTISSQSELDSHMRSMFTMLFLLFGLLLAEAVKLIAGDKDELREIREASAKSLSQTTEMMKEAFPNRFPNE